MGSEEDLVVLNDTRPLETLLMSGGAPQSPLMAGFLYALWNHKKTFLRFHTSGAGALMALLFISPKRGTPGEALKQWVEAGVSDEIYRLLPQNFKLFHKPGPFAPVLARLADRFKIPLERDDPRTSVPLDESLEALLTPKQLKALVHTVEPIRRAREKFLLAFIRQPDQRRLYNDFVDLMFAAVTPSSLTSRSLGLAAPLPFLEEIVDFAHLDARVKALGDGAHLCVNAYNMTEDARRKTDRRDKRRERLREWVQSAAGAGRAVPGRWAERLDYLDEIMEYFVSPYHADRREEHAQHDEDGPIDAERIRAAFSMPFIYPPAKIGLDFYSEGAAHEPINFAHAEKRGERPLVLLDVMGELEDYLVRKPRDLWDAYVISIMVPIVALAKLQIAEFKEDHPECDPDHPDWDGGLLTVDWEIPADAQPFVMDWSYSNLSTLFAVGERAGEAFVRKFGHRLRDRQP